MITPGPRELLPGRSFRVEDGQPCMRGAPGPWVSPARPDRATDREAALESFTPSAYGALYKGQGQHGRKP
jgi:hypothetical protein